MCTWISAVIKIRAVYNQMEVLYTVLVFYGFKSCLSFIFRHLTHIMYAICRLLLVLNIVCIVVVASTAAHSRSHPDTPDTESVEPLDLTNDPIRRRLVEESLLTLFKMDSRPEGKRLRAKDRIHVPQYMLDLYNYYVDEHKHSPTGYDEGLHSNTIRTFTHQGNYGILCTGIVQMSHVRG